MVVLWLRRHLQQRILRALSLGEQRQRLTCDVGLEMRALLMRLEGGFVTEQFVEQELCGIFSSPSRSETVLRRARAAPRARSATGYRRPGRPVLRWLPIARPPAGRRR